MAEKQLASLFKSWSGEDAVTVTALPWSGSDRKYFRIAGRTRKVIGAFNADRRENDAFLSFTSVFRGNKLPVPEVFAYDSNQGIYLLQDLGDTTLFSFLTEKRQRHDEFPSEATELYKSVLGKLPGFQVKAASQIDYSKCYPRPAFDRQSMMWDLNYFKYYFLKLAKIPFDEQLLEEDFIRLTDFLLEAESDFFLYRDFQSRNVMIVDGAPWFIDYQGGRRGALQYDVASLLTDAKADIPMPVRKELLYYYLDCLDREYPVDREKFLHYYYGFALIRILQALGAYGFRGYYENKPHFLQSIPYAMRNLRYLREQGKIGFGLNTLMKAIDIMVDKPGYGYAPATGSDLTVMITSFSYKETIPSDDSGNGGGFVFDCRALPNPGRYEEFRAFTGKDQVIIDYLKKEPEVDAFLNHAFALVDQSVRNYIDRRFLNLSVSFGCTGGQHRSVYCAEALSAYLLSKYNITVRLVHSSAKLNGK